MEPEKPDEVGEPPPWGSAPQAYGPAQAEQVSPASRQLDTQDKALVRLYAMRLAKALGAVLLAILVLVPVYQWFTPDKISGFEQRPPAPIASQAIPLTDLQEVRGWFGPWQMETSASISSDAIVMLAGNGQLDVSSYTATPNESIGWRQDSLSDVDVLYDGTTVQLRLVSDRRFTIAPGQPFILANRPNKVYAVIGVRNSYKHVIVSQDTSWLRQHATKQGK